MTNISGHLEELLLNLGDSADLVAESLKLRRIRGVRNTARMLNPIVQYIRGSVACLDADLIKAGSIRITLPEGIKIEATVPRTVREFLDAFNEGKFPEVEERRKKRREANRADAPDCASRPSPTAPPVSYKAR